MRFYAIKKWGLTLIAPKKLHLQRLIMILKFLKRTDPKAFRETLSRLKIILIAPYKGEGGVLNLEGQRPGIYAKLPFDGNSEYWTFYDLGKNKFGKIEKGWWASLLVRETHHMKQYLAGWFSRTMHLKAPYPPGSFDKFNGSAKEKWWERLATKSQIRYLNRIGLKWAADGLKHNLSCRKINRGRGKTWHAKEGKLLDSFLEEYLSNKLTICWIANQNLR